MIVHLRNLHLHYFIWHTILKESNYKKITSQFAWFPQVRGNYLSNQFSKPRSVGLPEGTVEHRCPKYRSGIKDRNCIGRV